MCIVEDIENLQVLMNVIASISVLSTCKFPFVTEISVITKQFKIRILITYGKSKENAGCCDGPPPPPPRRDL